MSKWLCGIKPCSLFMPMENSHHDTLVAGILIG